MGFRIATNVSSINAQKSLSRISAKESNTSAQLASGTRITRSSDDAAGLAISEKLRANIKSSEQANRNANDGISMIQVAEGGLTESANILIRLRELAIQSASDTIGDNERGYTNLEYQQLKSELQRISQTTKYNGVSLLDGSGDKLDFQIGAGNDQFEDRITYEPGAINAGIDALGMGSESVLQKGDAQTSLEKVDEAIKTVSGQRAILGALQNRLLTTSANLETSVENMSAANSRIRDVDYAAATAEKTQQSIMKQAGISVLAQANQSPQNALRLLS